MKKRWWIKEYRTYRDGYEIVAGPRFWTYRGALKKVARWQVHRATDVEYEYAIMRVDSTTREEGATILSSRGG
jgi:hypothetical protein